MGHLQVKKVSYLAKEFSIQFMTTQFTGIFFVACFYAINTWLILDFEPADFQCFVAIYYHSFTLLFFRNATFYILPEVKCFLVLSKLILQDSDFSCIFTVILLISLMDTLSTMKAWFMWFLKNR